MSIVRSVFGSGGSVVSKFDEQSRYINPLGKSGKAVSRLLRQYKYCKLMGNRGRILSWLLLQSNQYNPLLRAGSPTILLD